jgi:selenocysteine lyase/cysteine desulfurase
MRFDVSFLRKVRKQFDSIETDPRGRKRAFLDNGAGTLVTRRAAEMEAKARVDWSANVGNEFSESKGAEQTILEGRESVADLLNAEGPHTIVSGESATSLLFSLSYALGRGMTGKENIVTTGYEHYSNVNPWVELGTEGKISELRFADFDMETGVMPLDNLKKLVNKDTKVITVTAASNVLGTRSDLKAISKIAKDVGAYFVIDAVHHVAHGPTDVKDIGCDFLVFSGYKLFSRHGSFMYMKPAAMEDLMPYKVLPSPKKGPEKWEWGTRDQAMFAAITGAVDYLAWLGNPTAKYPAKAGPQRRARLQQAFKEIEKYEKQISHLVLEGEGSLLGLNYIPGITVYGPKDVKSGIGRDPTFAFKMSEMDDRQLSLRLWDEFALAVGAEDYYSRVPALYNEKTMLRATFCHYNTREEAVAFLKALNDIVIERRTPQKPAA